MARSSLQDFQGSIIDPVQSWNFDLVFNKLPTGIGGSTRDLTIRCQSTSLPGVTMEQVKVELHGVALNYRGRRTYSGTFSVTFAENVDWTTYQIFHRWHNMMLSWKNNTGSSSQLYKTTATLVSYDDAGNEVANFDIIGIWPSEVADISFSGDSSDYIKPEITFSYDYVEEES